MNFKKVGKDVPLPRYNCPMVDIDLLGNDLEHVTGIGSWQECGMSHNKSNCLFGHCPFHKIMTKCQIVCTMRFQRVSKILMPRRMLQKT